MSNRTAKLRISFILLAIIFFAEASHISAAQTVLRIPETKLSRGQTLDVQITGTVAPAASNIKIKFKFNQYLIDIKSAAGAPDYAFKCDKPITNTVFNLDDAIFEIECSDVQSVIDGVICMLRIEALAGPDSVTTLIPEEVWIDGVLQSDAAYEIGEFWVGAPVIQRFSTILNDGFPNPFSSRISFVFYLGDPTDVSFSIYSNSGRLVQKIPGENDGIRFFFFTNDGILINEPEKFNFQRGKYELVIEPISWEVSSGLYHLIMEAGGAVYRKSLIYIK